MATETTTITGSSDDLLEFEGHLYEEFGVSGDDGLLEFSDGTKVWVNYDGTWNFRAEHKGLAFDCIQECDDNDDEDYSDALIMGKVDWAKYTEGRYTQRVYAKGVVNPVNEIAEIIKRNDRDLAPELIQQLFEKRLADAKP